MIFQGKGITAKELSAGIVEMNFDLQGESVNKFDELTLREFRQVVDSLKADKNLRGVLVTSGKEAFIVGADIDGFNALFNFPEEQLAAMVREINRIFSDFEDLPVPTVAAINGLALGGGFEMCLACDYRIAAESARMGLPEIMLGIQPGFGGTVRLSRVAGVDNAAEWIAAGGMNHKPAAALKNGCIDAVAADDKLREAALTLLQRAVDGELDWRAKRQPKLEKLKLNPMEQLMAFESIKGFIIQKAGNHYPAPIEAMNSIRKGADHGREKALDIEAASFAKLAKTSVAKALVGLYHNDQVLKKKAKELAPLAREVKVAGVIGAGIMGGGIAFQSAKSGVPIVMKDIGEAGIKAGLDEATKLLLAGVEKGKVTSEKLAKCLTSIRPTLSYGDFAYTDLVVEAVVENPKVKAAVLAEVEGIMDEGAVLCSNTSTISITKLAEGLKRPENFIGMHFFNPVHKMPLVEIIRGKQTSDKAVATVLGYAKKLGKTPVVVHDCPGFWINRVLFPYMAGFGLLLSLGEDLVRIDKLAEKFGWPMGPAYLSDMVGIDTGHHASKVLEEGYPERVGDARKKFGKNAMDVLFEAGRFGQKNGKGFYAYELDKRGKPKKIHDPEIYELLKPIVRRKVEFSDEDIMNMMMIPLCLEAARCLEEGIVESAAEADISLIYGIGFPPFLGGAFRYMDTIGLNEFIALAERYAEYAEPLYQPTEWLRERAKNGQRFFA